MSSAQRGGNSSDTRVLAFGPLNTRKSSRVGLP
jgi:hypothetical protein